MSFEFDWNSLKPFLEQIISNFIIKIPININPMLNSNIELISINLSNLPPNIILHRIDKLSLNEQKFCTIFNYNGNALIEIKTDLNLNILNTTKKNKNILKFMGMLYSDVPMITKCRFLISNFQLSFKINIIHSKSIFIEFEDPPNINFTLDSNLSKLGPIFESAMNRIENIIKLTFNNLPKKLEINL